MHDNCALHTILTHWVKPKIGANAQHRFIQSRDRISNQMSKRLTSIESDKTTSIYNVSTRVLSKK